MFAELSTKGYHACHICGPNLHAWYSKDLNKCVYPEYRHFLPLNHDMRRKDLKKLMVRRKRPRHDMVCLLMTGMRGGVR